MLDLDEALFPELLDGINISGKRIADIGCGTGRHWAMILQRLPESLTGFDVSSGMLQRLREKFPAAHTRKINDNLFTDVQNAAYDLIVSTLTMAHIEDMEAALAAWCRILRPQADIIITDFHPEALAQGGKRTFQYHNTLMAVQNFVHRVQDIERALDAHGFYVVNRKERTVDESVRHYYAAKQALPVYERFKGARIIYGIHLRRN
jgi:ubiquinone/menaquinone biosynthesis C-methylase UbiE